MRRGTQSVSTQPTRDSDKTIIWQLYEAALRHHIETIWGWANEWQRAYFDKAFTSLTTQLVEVDGRFAGYVQVDAGLEEDYLSMLILVPGFQSRSMGARLLTQIHAGSRDAGRGLFLRVFRTNTNVWCLETYLREFVVNVAKFA